MTRPTPILCAIASAIFRMLHRMERRMSDRRGWLHMAAHDVEMRDQIRLIPAAMIGVSALDILDGLIGVIEAQQNLIDGQKNVIEQQDILLGTLTEAPRGTELT